MKRRDFYLDRDRPPEKPRWSGGATITSRLLVRFTDSSRTIENDRFPIDASLVAPGVTTFTLEDTAYPIASVTVEGELTVITLAGAPLPEHASLAKAGFYAEAVLPDGDMLTIDFETGKITQFRDIMRSDS